MIKIGMVIAAPLAVGFFIFPQFRTYIASIGPLALFALCPLGMLFGMMGMTKKDETCSMLEHSKQIQNSK